MPKTMVKMLASQSVTYKKSREILARDMRDTENRTQLPLWKTCFSLQERRAERGKGSISILDRTLFLAAYLPAPSVSQHEGLCEHQ